jgi:raffinose/stachyose/melibiose transport system substrate-binding protein
MPDGSAGDQGSVIGVETGYMVNAQSPNIDLAVEYLALVNSAENVQKFIEAEVIPITLSAQSGEVDGRSARLSELLNNAPAVVLPPDTGYNLEMASALYAAEAAVLGGQVSVADALAGLDQQLGRQ